MRDAVLQFERGDDRTVLHRKIVPRPTRRIAYRVTMPCIGNERTTDGLHASTTQLRRRILQIGRAQMRVAAAAQIEIACDASSNRRGIGTHGRNEMEIWTEVAQRGRSDEQFTLDAPRISSSALCS